MVEISEEQLTIIENAFETILQSLDPQSTPPEIKKQILDAQQICSGLLDNAKQAPTAMAPATDNKGGPK